jgi:hypothetical protein
MLEMENNWKGRVWVIYFVWPLLVIGYFVDFDLEGAGFWDWVMVFLFALSIVPWIIQTKKLIVLLKK